MSKYFDIQYAYVFRTYLKTLIEYENILCWP